MSSTAFVSSLGVAARPSTFAWRGALVHRKCPAAMQPRFATSRRAFTALADFSAHDQFIQFLAAAEASGARKYLQPIADGFKSLNFPAEVVKYGHPVSLISIVLFVGIPAVKSGWDYRTGKDGATKRKGRDTHLQAAPLLLLFVSIGWLGGILSLVMQDKPLFESAHFMTGTAGLGLLYFNAVLSGFFGRNDKAVRTAHAIVGSASFALLLAQFATGFYLSSQL